MISYTDFVTDLQVWWKRVVGSNESMGTPRDWCRLGADGAIDEVTLGKRDLTQAGLNVLFDTELLDAEIVEATTTKSKQATAYKIAEIDLIHGLHKSMVARHKGRLQTYRDDMASKQFHNWRVVSLGLGSFLAQKQRSEKANG